MCNADVFDLHRIIANCKTAMHYVDISLHDDQDNSVPVTCLFDSGSQMSVVRADIIVGLQYHTVGSVALRGFDNHKSHGDLITLYVRLQNSSKSVPVRFVVCENVSHECLLSLADYRRLIEQNDNTDDQASAVTCDPSAIVNEGSISDPVDDATQGAEDDSVIQADDDNDVNVTDETQSFSPLTAPDKLINPDTSEVNKLVDEQKNNEILHGAFELAKNNKGGYFLKYDLLFHRTYIRDSVVDRLVVPLCRCISILDLERMAVRDNM